MHNRENALSKWLEQSLATNHFKLTPLTNDASFRRYYRLHFNNLTRVVMDAPPDKEILGPFLAVAHLLRQAGVHTPQIHAVDLTQGFIILDDLGDNLLLHHLRSETADALYKTAMDTISTIQRCTSAALPRFDKSFILTELAIFREWFLQAYLKIQLTNQEEWLIEETFRQLSDRIIKQPQVVIHRDFHSRNILLLNEDNKIKLGIIDFQDAMQGPFTYDLVSLLKDCYIQWPCEEVMKWLSYFHAQIKTGWALTDFIRAFDYCGLQRHLKVLGIFARLHLRDKKANYLQDLPLTFHYVLTCLECYQEFKPFYQFMRNRVELP